MRARNMRTRKWPNKDPDDVLDYAVNWSDWLGTDTISASTWVIPSGLTEDSSTFDSTTTTVWLSGGTNGTTYSLTNRITTTAGRQVDRSLTLVVSDR